MIFTLNLLINTNTCIALPATLNHTKKGIPFGIALRLHRICSTDSTDNIFHFRTKELTTFLTKHSYKLRFIKQQIVRVASISRSDALQYHGKKHLIVHLLFQPTILLCPYCKSSPTLHVHTTAAKHFLLTPNHSSYDTQLIAIEKIFSYRDTVCMAWEVHLIFKANTLESYGLNTCKRSVITIFSTFFLFSLI